MGRRAIIISRYKLHRHARHTLCPNVAFFWVPYNIRASLSRDSNFGGLDRPYVMGESEVNVDGEKTKEKGCPSLDNWRDL